MYNSYMNNIKPYTYKITNEITGHWYIGKKTANEVPAEEDITYWGSSKYLKDLMIKFPEGWTKTIIAEYSNGTEAGIAEEELLEKNWDLPGRVNRAKRNGRNIDYLDPIVKEKFLKECRNKDFSSYRTPEFRQKMSDLRKNDSTEIKQKRIDASRTSEVRAMKSEKAKNAPEEIKKKRILASKAKAKVIIATNIATGEEFEMQGTKEIESYEFNNGSVSQCCNGKYAKNNIHKGYTFRYKYTQLE
jgi:hypothetical protein